MKEGLESKSWIIHSFCFAKIQLSLLFICFCITNQPKINDLFIISHKYKATLFLSLGLTYWTICLGEEGAGLGSHMGHLKRLGLGWQQHLYFLSTQPCTLQWARPGLYMAISGTWSCKTSWSHGSRTQKSYSATFHWSQHRNSLASVQRWRNRLHLLIEELSSQL